MREQQSQGGPEQPNHFTPAFYTPNEKDEGYAYGAAMNGGAQPRRLYANTTPTSYTTPGVYPLTRGLSDSGKADAPTKQGFYDSPAYWLILYFFFNLGLTLFNKIVLVSFPFPYASSAFTYTPWHTKLTNRPWLDCMPCPDAADVMSRLKGALS
jgi:hypothetical protein